MQMKRKRLALFAAVALSALLLLGACGGVSQEDLDAALADLTAAESQLSSAQGAVTTAAAERDQAVADLSLEQDSTTLLRTYLANSNEELALVREELTSVSAELADALAAVPEGEPAAAPVSGGAYNYVHPAEISFTPVDVTVDDYGFSFQHPDALLPAGAGIDYSATDAAGVWGLWLYADILVADAATFEDALAAYTYLEDLEIRDNWNTTLANGTPASLADYTATLGGWPCSGVAIGMPSGDNWIMLFTWRWPLGDLDPVDVEIVHTLTLQ